MSTDKVYVSLEFTPNPNTLKYVVNRELLKRGSVSFLETGIERAEEESPLAAALLAIEGISGVMIGRDFVTVTKDPAGDWESVHKSASDLVKKMLENGDVIVNESAIEKENSNLDSISIEIKAIIDSEIRPAVARDGGDITFDRFENGTVFVELLGACSGCPSSTATLKLGIENRLRERFSEVKEVVSL